MIYKYTTVSGAIQILEKGRLRLSKSEHFNDPFDSNKDFNRKNEFKANELLENAAIYSYLFSFVDNKTIKLDAKSRDS